MRSLNYRYILQWLSTVIAIAVMTLTLVAAVTGILLAFYYEPSAGGAYDSLQAISTKVPYGNLIRSLHDEAGNLVIGIALIQMVVLFLSRESYPSWITAWLSGILFILMAIGLSWTAILLDWNQIGYWRLKVELGLISVTPLIGEQLREVLVGGAGISSLTVQHMYALHSYVLSVGAVVLSILHLAALIYQQQERRRALASLDVMATSE